MNLDDISVLICTLNEEANIERTLRACAWAKSIVVVDSFSTDQTLAILKSYPNVRVYQRSFDNFAAQKTFGLSQVRTKWTFCLDADYVLNRELRGELEAASDAPCGYRISFRYCVFSVPLSGSLYPTKVALFQTKLAKFVMDGHTERVDIPEPIENLASLIDHDDWKPMTGWIKSQANYAKAEADKLESEKNQIRLQDRVRRIPFLAPILILPYCLLIKGNIRDGSAGFFYAMQRFFAELCLSMELMDRSLRKRQQQTLSG